MRELVRAINTHVEMVDLEVTNNLNVAEDIQAQQFPADQPNKEAPTQPTEDLVLPQSTDPAA